MVSATGIRAGAAYIELYTKDNRLVRGLNRASAKLKAFSMGVESLAKRMLALGTVMATPLIAGVKIFADFEQQMANVSTMLQHPEVHLKTFQREVRRMSVAFGESTEALAGGLYDILSASVDADQALGVLEVSVKAAKAGMTDTAIAADAITTVMNAYGLSAEKAGDVSDWLFGIVKRGKTTFAALAPTIGNIATTASSAGLGLDELGATLALLTRNGIKTEEAITATQAIISTFLKPSAEGAALARKLGFELSAATLRAEGLQGVFQKIAGLPPDAVATLFPNVRAMKGVLPALQAMDQFAADIDGLKNRAGSTQEAFEKMTGTLAFRFAQLKEAGKVALSVIGEALSEPLKNGAEALVRFSTMLADFIKQNKQAVLQVARVVGIILAVGTALLLTSFVVKAFALAMSGVVAIVTGVGTVIGLLGSLLAALLSPIGLVVMAVAALGAMLIMTTDIGSQALDWLGKRFEALKETAQLAFKGMADALAAGDMGLAAKILWLTLKMEWLRGVNFLKNKWAEFKEFFLKLGSEAFYGAAILLNNAWSSLEVAWVETTSFLSRTWTEFTTWVVSNWNKASAAVRKQWAKLEALVKGEDGKKAVAKIEAEVRQENTRIQQKAQQQLDQTEQQRQQRRKRIEQERRGAEDELGQQFADETAKRKQAQQAELDTSAKALQAARQEWQAAIKQAGEKRKEKEAEEPPRFKNPQDLLKEAEESLSGVSSRMKDTSKKTVEVQGSFSAVAARGLSAGGARDKTEENTKEIAKNTKKLVQQAQHGGVVFS